MMMILIIIIIITTIIIINGQKYFTKLACGVLPPLKRRSIDVNEVV